MIETELHDRVVTVRLNDPVKRNALSLPMFDALDGAIARVAGDEGVNALLLLGNGAAFCAGFDLGAAVEQPPLIATYIERLSRLNRALRRLPQVVIAAVHGAAIAGGCAVVSACDFVYVGPEAMLGYPVHQLGISPAVTTPTLAQAIGSAASRKLLLSGELIDGRRAHAIGLATHLATANEVVHAEAVQFAHEIASKPPNALRTTKRWLNELDGSMDDELFDAPAVASAGIATDDEAVSMLRTFWRRRAGSSHTK